MSTLIIDIETAPNLSFEMEEKMIAEARWPANYKDPAKIQEWLAEYAVKIRDKAALSPLTGKIIAIGMSDIREDEVWTATNKDDERVVLEEFKRVFESYARTGSVTVAGFNVREFDVPFILGRCIVNDMLPYGFPRKGKDWQRVLDVRDSIPDGSLDQWSTALGIGRKAHASNGIWLFEPSEIEAQVSTDVVLTRTILRRLIPQRDAAFYAD